MTFDPDTQALLGAAVLSLGFVPLCCRSPASAVWAAIAQWTLLAAVLAAHGVGADAPELVAAATLLLATGLLLLPRALRLSGPGTAGADAVFGDSAGGRALLGLGLVTLGASVARDAVLLQPAALRATLPLALPTLLLGLLAAARRAAGTRIAGLAVALGGVLLATSATPDDGLALVATLGASLLVALLLLLAALAGTSDTGATR